MTKTDNIWERLIQFAAKIDALADTLSQKTDGELTVGQPLHSEITPMLNRIEARSTGTPAGDSRILEIAVSALKATEIMLHMTNASQILSLDMVTPLLVECYQLQHVFSAGIKSESKPANGKPAAARLSTTQLPNYPTRELRN